MRYSLHTCWFAGFKILARKSKFLIIHDISQVWQFLCNQTDICNWHHMRILAACLHFSTSQGHSYKWISWHDFFFILLEINHTTLHLKSSRVAFLSFFHTHWTYPQFLILLFKSNISHIPLVNGVYFERTILASAYKISTLFFLDTI